MKTIAYFIDPLFVHHPDQTETGWSDVLLPLLEQLPDYRHLLVTTNPDISLEEELRVQANLIYLKVKKPFFGKIESVLQKKLSQWLEAEKVSLLVSFEPAAVVTFSGKTILITGTQHLLTDSGGKRTKKRPKSLPNWLKSEEISLPFESDKQELIELYPELSAATKVFYPAMQENVSTISWSEQETVKIRHSGGRDYFLYMGPLTAEKELVELLKAYSLLKKWLMTGMPLLLVGPTTEYTPRLTDLLKTYKYRADVTVLPDLEDAELKPILAGAYLLAYPFSKYAPAWPLEWAILAGTPILTTDTAEARSITGNAAAFAVSGDLDAWAHQMMLLYKDEPLRTRQIELGQVYKEKQNQEQTMAYYAGRIRELSD